MSSRFDSCLEPLESRIAPAAVIHPLPDITAGAGQTGALVDLSKLFDNGETGNYANRTLITIRTNFDADPLTPGIQGDITIELFDDLAPLTVQNFLRYALNPNSNGDYDGTFFHRLDLGSLSVLQGGGFQTNGKKLSHIDSLAEVHNEYDPSRPNTRGTLALAKTGVGPDTGTSEWFINLADNSDTLDDRNNGGFTVFGQVIDRPGVVDGMEVIDRMAALPKVQGIVGSFPTPVQNYSSDPDNNPKTPSPKVKPGNLITIQDVIVEPSHGGNDDGVIYKSVTVEDISGDTGLLGTPTRNGSELILNYAPGKAGVSKVTVQVEKDGEVVDESFLVTVLPNLTTHIHAYNLPTVIVPGDTSKIQLDIVNNGGAVAKGTVQVRFYLEEHTFDSLQQKWVPTGEIVEANSFEKVIDLGSGKSLVFTADFQVPQAISSDPGSVYKPRVEIVPMDDFNSEELYPHDSLHADNIALEGGLHQLHNQFGTFNTQIAGGRSGAVLRYTEPDGDIVELSIKGAGTGKLTAIADGIVDLQLSGTNAKTQVFAKVVGSDGESDGVISIRNIDALTTLGFAKWSSIDLQGNLAFSNGVKQLELGKVSGPSTISIAPIPGAEATRVNLTFGSITDLTLESTMNIGSFRATEWLDTMAGGQDALIAPALQTLLIGSKTARETIRGDLQADVELTSSSAVKSFVVTGVLEDSRVRIYGNVGTVELGAMHDSSFLVGANERPESLAGFTEDRTVRKFTIKGLDSEPQDFVNSTIAAVRFLNLNLQGTIDFSSGSDEFGVVADVIDRYQRGSQPVGKLLKTPQEYDTATNWNYLVRIV